jgi:hypothetical protein
MHKKWFKTSRDKEVYDPVREEFKERASYQCHSCYYPSQRIFDKYYERNCDTFSINLWKSVYGDRLSQEEMDLCISQLYDKAIPQMIDSMPILDWDIRGQAKHIMYDY